MLVLLCDVWELDWHVLELERAKLLVDDLPDNLVGRHREISSRGPDRACSGTIEAIRAVFGG